MANASAGIGETNDSPAPGRARSGSSLTQARLDFPLTPLSLLLLSFAMSTDAFAAAIGKGSSLHKPRFTEALRAGLIFGIIEAITPLVGWLIGQAASRFVLEWDHWIAFVLLAGLGAHMIHAGLGSADEAPERRPTRHSFWALAVTAVATSIDALAVGVSLAFVEVNILVAALCIGLATALMVTLGMLLGRMLGQLVGKRTEIVGGVVLILLGATILYEHFASL